VNLLNTDPVLKISGWNMPGVEMGLDMK